MGVGSQAEKQKRKVHVQVQCDNTYLGYLHTQLSGSLRALRS